MVRPLMRMMITLDVRQLVPLVAAPTLVLHTSDSPVQPLAHGEYIAAHLPGARISTLESGDHFPSTPRDLDWFATEIQEFLTGVRPAPVLDEDRVLATVLYTDFVDSTRRTAERGDHAWRDLLDRHDEIARRHIEDHRGTWVKHTGDGVIATFDGPARAVRCARAIRDSVRSLGIETRSGLHTGEIEIRGDDYSGIAMSIGARVMSVANPGEVLVSSTVVDLVAGSGLEFDDRGEHELKGVPRPWRIYSVRP
jgi:class 3 adenylate cyclase